MTDHPRALALLAHVTRGLLRHGEQRTAQNLGDRSTYVGLSDVGRAITCLRAAVAGKLGNGVPATGDDIAGWLRNGQEPRIRETLRRQMILQRGHWLEGGVQSALRANGANLISQLEIHVPDNAVPIQAHLDFVVVRGGDRPALRVLELKSTEHLPETLYPGYEAQLYGQIGMLEEFWSEPVFQVKDEDGDVVLANQDFPQLCRHRFGIALPDKASDVDTEGWVLCLSMSDAKAFGPYQSNSTMSALCRRTAYRLWTTTEAVRAGRLSLADVEFCPGFHPLCDWCDHADSCPKFSADPVNDRDLDDDLTELANLKAERHSLDGKIGVREERIRQFCRRAGNDTRWLSTGNFRFKTTRIAGRKTIDATRLRTELINRAGEQDADAMLARATTAGAGYERLTISPIKP